MGLLAKDCGQVVDFRKISLPPTGDSSHESDGESLGKPVSEAMVEPQEGGDLSMGGATGEDGNAYAPTMKREDGGEGSGTSTGDSKPLNARNPFAGLRLGGVATEASGAEVASDVPAGGGDAEVSTPRATEVNSDEAVNSHAAEEGSSANSLPSEGQSGEDEASFDAEGDAFGGTPGTGAGAKVDGVGSNSHALTAVEPGVGGSEVGDSASSGAEDLTVGYGGTTAHEGSEHAPEAMAKEEASVSGADGSEAGGGLGAVETDAMGPTGVDGNTFAKAVVSGARNDSGGGEATVEDADESVTPLSIDVTQLRRKGAPAIDFGALRRAKDSEGKAVERGEETLEGLFQEESFAGGGEADAEFLDGFDAVESYDEVDWDAVDEDFGPAYLEETTAVEGAIEEDVNLPEPHVPVSLGLSGDPDPEEFEAFEGFKTAAQSNPEPTVEGVSTGGSRGAGFAENGVPEGAAEDRFEQQLEDLLSDDETELLAVPESVESAESGGPGDGEIHGGEAVSEEVIEASKLRVVDNTIPQSSLPPGLSEAYDKKAEDWGKTAEDKKLREAERQASVREKGREASSYTSDFHRKPTAVVTVDGTGRERKDPSKAGKRRAKAAVGGALKPGEIDFFVQLGLDGSGRKKVASAGVLNRGPLSKIESEEQRREREERLEKVFAASKDYKSAAKFKLNRKMFEVLSFLALFRYATHRHLARMFSEAERTASDRLYRMKRAGLVVNKKIYAQADVWYLTEAGMIVSGYDTPRVTDSRLTYSMFPHQFTVNHTAANLWGGRLNVLNLKDFPVANRRDMEGKLVLGEELTSELEILSSFSRMKLFDNSASFRPRLMQVIADDFIAWERAGEPMERSPEMIYGNEWMWALLPPLTVGLAYHVPDLVVKRPRLAVDRPQSIAVEIEISTKPAASYRRTLEAYAADERIFGQVIWICKTLGPAKKLESIGRELGLIQSGKLKIVPIWTDEGVFKAKDLWTI